MQNNCKVITKGCKAIAKLLQIDYKANAERLQSDCKADRIAMMARRLHLYGDGTDACGLNEER
jgi:hypothetical protein